MEPAAEIHDLTDKPGFEDQHQRPGPAVTGPASQPHPGRGYPQVSVPCAGSGSRPGSCRGPRWRTPVLDLIAAARSFDDAYGWISAAVGRRLAPPELLGKALAGALADALARLGRRGGYRAPANSVHSPLERQYVRGVERAHGLPAARRQARRRHGNRNAPDNLYEGVPGYASNWTELRPTRRRSRWRDTHRDNANLVQGTDTLRYGWPDATEHRCRTAAEIAVVLRGRGFGLAPCAPAARQLHRCRAGGEGAGGEGSVAGEGSGAGKG